MKLMITYRSKDGTTHALNLEDIELYSINIFDDAKKP